MEKPNFEELLRKINAFYGEYMTEIACGVYDGAHGILYKQYKGTLNLYYPEYYHFNQKVPIWWILLLE
jgi:hypothetical protein